MPSGLFALLDDAATLMRHSASQTSPTKILAATKTATMKTTGIMSDDLAIKSKGVIGISPDREGPIVGKIFKRCLQNLAWILPTTFAVSIAAPVALPFITAAGGAFLAYEGAHSLSHILKDKFSGKTHDHDAATNYFGQTAEEIEKEIVDKNAKIGIVNSLEMTLIAMATLGNTPIITQLPAVVVNGAAMAVIVHGTVYGIVRMDDWGVALSAKEGDGPIAKAQRLAGKTMLKTLPWVMDQLPTLGLTAMFTVGGELVGQHIPAVEHVFHAVGQTAQSLTPAISILPQVSEFVANMGITGLAGLAVGFSVAGAEKIIGPHIKTGFGKVGKFIKDITKGFDQYSGPKEPEPDLSPKQNLDAETVMAAVIEAPSLKDGAFTPAAQGEDKAPKLLIQGPVDPAPLLLPPQP